MSPSIYTTITMALSLLTLTSATPISSAITSSQLSSRQTPGQFVETTFLLYSSTNCQGNELTFDLSYLDGAENLVAQLTPFQSVKFGGGQNAGNLFACAEGFSCFDGTIIQIDQDGTTCTSAPAGSFDKVLIDS